MITDVLDLSKIEAGELLISRVTFNPRHLLQGLGTIMAQVADKMLLIARTTPLIRPDEPRVNGAESKAAA